MYKHQIQEQELQDLFFASPSEHSFSIVLYIIETIESQNKFIISEETMPLRLTE